MQSYYCSATIGAPGRHERSVTQNPSPRPRRPTGQVRASRKSGRGAAQGCTDERWRILRSKIESGHYQHCDALPSADLAQEHEVSVPVVLHALAMLAANRYVDRPDRFASCRVTSQAVV